MWRIKIRKNSKKERRMKGKKEVRKIKRQGRRIKGNSLDPSKPVKKKEERKSLKAEKNFFVCYSKIDVIPLESGCHYRGHIPCVML